MAFDGTPRAAQPSTRVSDGGAGGSRPSNGGVRARVRAVLLVTIVALFAVYVAVAVLNCVAWLRTDVRDPGEDPS